MVSNFVLLWVCDFVVSHAFSSLFFLFCLYYLLMVVVHCLPVYLLSKESEKEGWAWIWMGTEDLGGVWGGKP